MMDIDEQEAYEWDRLIRRTVRFVVSDFPDVEYEDVVQDVWVWLIKQKRSWMKTPDDYGSPKRLRNRAIDIAWGVRKEQLHQSPQYMYRPSDVRKILETVFQISYWDGAFVPADARSRDGLTGMDAVDVRIDVKWAFENLSGAYREALLSRYQDGIEPPSATRERRQLNRAIRRLTDRLNSYYCGTSPRRAISNAAARALVENQEGS